MRRTLIIYLFVLALVLAFAGRANAAHGDVLLTCVAQIGGAQSATQWEMSELDAKTKKSVIVRATEVELAPHILWGTTYMQITTAGQDDEVVPKWNRGESRAMDNGVQVTCYFQHDDD